MKKTFLILAALIFGLNMGHAQKIEMMPKVEFSKILNTSADNLWETVRKMDQIHKYSSAIAKVEWKGNMGIGGERVCHTPDGKGYFKEKIVAYDESSRSFSYALLEGAPVKGMTNTMQVVDLGYGKCVLVWWSYYDEFMENPQMTEEQFQAFMLNSLEEMSVKMETINSGSGKYRNRYFI